MDLASADPNTLPPAINICAFSSGVGCRIFNLGVHQRRTVLVPLLCCFALVGCETNKPVANAEATSQPADSAGAISPQIAARQALQRKDLTAAKQLIREAVIASPNDPETLKLAAEISLASGDRLATTNWMIEVARQSKFSDEKLVQQCVAELLVFGKFFESIDLLEDAVQAQPSQSENRRNLLYLLANAEQHHRVQQHGRVLIQERAFDKTLLFLMAIYEQRDIDPTSMNAFAQLNPTDHRLEIAKLRVLFDNGQWDQFPEVAHRIIASSPNFVAAHLLLGQYYVETDQFDHLSLWVKNVGEDAQHHWQYWDVLGDWAMRSKKYPQAARAYFEASRRDPAIGSVATKLARSLQFCDQTLIPPDAIKIAGDRGELLGRFLQAKERFHKLHRRSNAAIAEMATTLEQLGRLWEAEAWTAIGLTEPDQDVDELTQIRQRLVSKLQQKPPWQVETGHPFVSLDLSSLPLPNEESFVVSSAPKRPPVTSPSREPRFAEESQKRGLIDESCDPVTVGNGVIPLYSQLGFGGAALDFDSDGWTDIYLASCGKEPLSSEEGRGQLFRNLDGVFSSTRNLNGIEDQGFSQGVTAGDINEDGFVDLVLLNYGCDQVFINDGDGTFSERKGWIQNPDCNWSTSGAIADIDLDGISDFVCLKYCEAKEPLQRQCIVPSANTIEYCVPTDFDAEADQFFRGQPEGMWENANDLWDAVPASPGRGLGIIVGQLDGAPGMDIYVANDMTSNHYWSVAEQESFQLQETATIRGLALDRRSRPQASMGIAAADMDRDNDVDLLVTNFSEEHNTLYEQTSPGIWEDRSHVAGLVESSFQNLGFGVQAVDLDNDSQLELVVANGHVHHNAQSGYAQRPQVLRRLSSGNFESIEATHLGSYFRNPHVGRALWCLDFDRDHLLDLVVTHQGEPTALLHNETPETNKNHWLRMKLAGTESARDPVGSVVSASCGELHRTATFVAGDGFFCSNEDTLHFGFGPTDNEKEVHIEVTWPSGKTHAYRTQLNQECLIVEGDEDVFVY